MISPEDFPGAPKLALDTEFVWNRTFHPAMGLVQAATSDSFDPAALPCSPPAALVFKSDVPEENRALLLDAAGKAAGLCARSIAPLLSNPSIVKILHDSTQDISHLSHWCVAIGGVPAPSPRTIFDTRLAAGFCDLPSTLSLAKLAEETLGKVLPKSETLTDWLHRPLTEAQARYAAQDVVYLESIASELVRRASSLGTLRWMFAEMAALDDPSLYAPPSPSEAWRKARLPTSVLAKVPGAWTRVKALAAWRERMAEARNLPRKWVVSYQVLLDAALYPERDFSTVPARELSPKFRRGFEAALREASALPHEAPPALHITDSATKSRADRILAVVREEAVRLHIDPFLLATRAAATSFAANPDNPSHPFVATWRAEALAGAMPRIKSC